MAQWSEYLIGLIRFLSSKKMKKINKKSYIEEALELESLFIP
jgi:hypothetical protein